MALQNQQDSEAAQARSDLAAQYVRANPRPAVSFVHSEQFICPRKAIGNRLEIPSSFRAFCGLLHSSVLLRSANLDYAKLRVLRALRMTDRGDVRRGRLFSAGASPRPTVLCARRSCGDMRLLRQEQFSLRLGHTRVLTPHRGVIHYARAASLPPPYGFMRLPFVRRGAFFREEQAPPLQGLCAFRLYGGVRLLRTTNGRPYKLCAVFSQI